MNAVASLIGGTSARPRFGLSMWDTGLPDAAFHLRRTLMCLLGRERAATVLRRAPKRYFALTVMEGDTNAVSFDHEEAAARFVRSMLDGISKRGGDALAFHHKVSPQLLQRIRSASSELSSDPAQAKEV